MMNVTLTWKVVVEHFDAATRDMKKNVIGAVPLYMQANHFASDKDWCMVAVVT